jgi:threonine synthase
MTGWSGIINAYRDYMPVAERMPVTTLCEGNTPLIRSMNIGPKLGIDLYFKYEGLNPTGSFKDRGMTMAISKAREEGARAVICASTGNTSASAAAYAAAAGLKCIVVIPKGKIGAGKLAQAIAHQALVLAVDANFDKALEIVRYLTDKYPITLVNSINAHRLQGQKTAAFEICDALGEAPEILAIPVGNAGNITAYWMGFNEYRQRSVSTRLPRMFGFQAAGSAPIVLGRTVENPETIASAIRIGNPVRWTEAEEAASTSGGAIDMVTDEEILRAYELLAGTEGIFVEPASAASVAGLIKLADRKPLPPGALTVSVLTGHGLKDPNIVGSITNKVRQVEATKEAVEEIILEDHGRAIKAGKAG